MYLRSLIYGRNLTDVIITGDNGTIDGQGSVWWNWFRTKTLNYTRPHMVELIDSTDVIISNLTFLNSPFWNIHPVYCSKVIVQNLTIIAPLDSPNTDGIDPDFALRTWKISEDIENQCAKVITSTPMTPELFLEWKKKKMEARDAAEMVERANNDRMSK
ncbi:hypothetical protein POM88_044622 [Heracleum sosnowskyi]|uniref:ZC3H15/TMA46 family C-terminal domain-containing protein n=1 Tax=Heracleum sosnowskyi TaxID=360622 RepID=A0AAD8H5K9_9APIA|nr:hypothetical protein POM88_044622 [Heracleum sosnowskyi]